MISDSLTIINKIYSHLVSASGFWETGVVAILHISPAWIKYWIFEGLLIILFQISPLLISLKFVTILSTHGLLVLSSIVPSLYII